MKVDVELNIYKSLVMLLADESENLNGVIERLLEGPEGSAINFPVPVNQRSPGYWYRGMWHRSENAIDVYLLFLETLGQEFDFFYSKFAEECLGLGNSRLYFTKEKDALYPENQNLKRYARPVCDWWADGNISNKQKLHLMHLAADTAGLKLGRDYKISLPNAE